MQRKKTLTLLSVDESVHMTHTAGLQLGSGALEPMLTMALSCLHSPENEECRFRSLGEPRSGSSHHAVLHPGKIFPNEAVPALHRALS